MNSKLNNGSTGVPACSKKPSPQLREVECPRCGQELELWSDEEVSACSSCGEEVRNGVPQA